MTKQTSVNIIYLDILYQIMDQDQAIQKFKETLGFHDASEQTLKRYPYVIKDFINYTKKEDASEIDKDDVISYMMHLRRRGWGGNYRTFVFSVLRLFFESLEKPWQFSRKEGPKPVAPYRPWFTLEEVEKLLEVARSKKPKVHALVRIAALTGPRRAELANLKWGDYSFPKLRFETLKHGEIVDRIIDFETKDALDPMEKKKGRIFDISNVQMSSIFKGIKEEAGINKEKAGVHSLRRSLVTFLADAGLSDSKIGRYLGWKQASNIPMIDIYRQLDPKELQKEVVKVHPLIPENEKENIIKLL